MNQTYITYELTCNVSTWKLYELQAGRQFVLSALSSALSRFNKLNKLNLKVFYQLVSMAQNTF